MHNAVGGVLLCSLINRRFHIVVIKVMTQMTKFYEFLGWIYEASTLLKTLFYGNDILVL